MSALAWKQAACVWWSAFRDCQALLAMCRAELDAADQRVTEALDERDVAVAAHYELARDFDRQRDELRAVQSELSYRATHGPELARDEAEARWRAARDRRIAAEHEHELAADLEDAAQQDVDAAHRAVVSGERKGVAA